MTPVRRVLVLCALALVCVGCRVDADVRLRLFADGSGTVSAAVRLDAEAVQRLEVNGRVLADVVRLTDLADAGWEVGEWVRGDDGGATVQLVHAFGDGDELSARLAELDGGAVVRDAAITRERGFLESRDEISVDLDLREIGTRILDDEELVASLQAAGIDVATLDQQLQTELSDSLRVSMRLEAPGEKVTTAELGPGQEQSVAAARSRFDTNRLVLSMIAGMLAFLALLLYVAASASGRRSRSQNADDSGNHELDDVPLM